MEAPAGPPRLPKLPTQPNIDKIKQRLIGKGVFPTPKIIHTLRKKQLQKSKRRIAKQSQTQTLTDSQKQEIAEETQFQTLKAEYRSFTKAIDAKDRNSGEVLMVGKPWERLERNGLRELAIESTEYAGEKLKEEHLRELSDIMEKERNKFAWLLDDDVELDEGLLEKRKRIWSPPKRTGGEVEAISFLVDKMSGTNLTVKDWKLSKMMKHSGLVFTEGQLLRLVEGLGRKGEWRHAISVVEWVYNLKEHKHYKSRNWVLEFREFELRGFEKSRRRHEVGRKRCGARWCCTGRGCPAAGRYIEPSDPWPIYRAARALPSFGPGPVF